MFNEYELRMVQQRNDRILRDAQNDQVSHDKLVKIGRRNRNRFGRRFRR